MSEKFSFEQALLQELAGIRQALEAIAKPASESTKARPRFTAPPKWLSDEIVEELLVAGGQKELDRLEAAKMTRSAVEALRSDRASGASYKTLCEKYGISMSTVSRIVRREHWT